MIIELSNNQSANIRFIRQIRERADLRKRQESTYRKRHFL